MLKGIDPLLSAEVLGPLAAMGHGDELALVDRNYPAAATARRLVRWDGVDTLRAAKALLSVFPLDTFIAEPVARMQVVDDPDSVPDVQAEFLAYVSKVEQRQPGVARLDRFAFYERSRHAFLTVLTGEARPYGCLLLTKGVIFG